MECVPVEDVGKLKFESGVIQGNGSEDVSGLAQAKRIDARLNTNR